MAKFSAFFSSSIGKKLLMALTGLFLCSFLVIHLTGNLQLLKHDGGLAFNTYAVFMTTNPLIKTVSWGLYLSILFHAFLGLWLAYQNKMARPVGYAKHSGNAPWYSRSMAILGTLLLLFIVGHMADFWFEYKFGKVPYTEYHILVTNPDAVSSKPYTGHIEGKMAEYTTADNQTRVVVVKDLYVEVAESFREWWLVALYVLAMGVLAFHLIHGFKSAFQSMGLNHPKYNGIIRFIGIGVFGIAIPIAFAIMPLYFFFFHN
ncbi:MAG: succinate dehydrogenase cytochrome b subunit [Bacteroidia bacterium]|nr:succinate dehydrogenase cytochrome b subunit [Bacteroidia bacterium]